MNLTPQRPLVCAAAAALCLMIGGTVIGQESDPSPTEPTESSTTLQNIDIDWGMQLAPIDRWLRMHLMIPPDLAPIDANLMIESIDPGSIAETWQMRPGDVLLENQSGPLRHAGDLESPDRTVFLRVLRRGRPTILHRKPWGQNISPPVGLMPPMGMPNDFGQNRGSSASSFAINGSAMAITQSGSDVEIHVSENGNSQRLSGTIDEIRKQLDGSKLSPETIAKIRRSLNQMER